MKFTLMNRAATLTVHLTLFTHSQVTLNRSLRILTNSQGTNKHPPNNALNQSLSNTQTITTLHHTTVLHNTQNQLSKVLTYFCSQTFSLNFTREGILSLKPINTLIPFNVLRPVISATWNGRKTHDNYKTHVDGS